MLIVFDDDTKFRERYKEYFSKLGIKLEVLECSTKAEIREQIAKPEVIKQTKVIVFDLSETKEEAESMNFDILEDIKRYYSNYAIPIFIHSAFADKIEGHDNLGTLYKIKKDADSVEQIIDKIRLYYESGFLDLFSPGGILETKLHEQLHSAFIDQFRSEEISGILNSIKHANFGGFRERTLDVFQRIAVRALYQNMMSEKKTPESGRVDEIRINAVEHYYRRKGDFLVWTGDIFKKKSGERLIVLTPRCDINNNNCKGNYLACSVEILDEKSIASLAKEISKMGDYVNDNISRTGYKKRYLIPTPSFSGGFVDLNSYFIVSQAALHGDGAEYQYEISLSDELTNDVVRKFTSSLLRGGISASELNEATYYAAVLADKNKENKSL